MKLKYILILLMLGGTVNLSAKDGVSFIHSFGELRVYFKDWLVVCADKGEGECRMVNYVYDKNNHEKEKFFPDSRLTLIPAQSNKGAIIDFYHKNAPSEIIGIDIAVDREKYSFDETDYKTPKQNRVMETYIVNNQTKLKNIMEASKPARWLTFRYVGISGQESKVRFSLRGFTKAFNFIQRQTSI